MEKDSFGNGQPVNLKYTISNNTDHVLYVLVWHTPLKHHRQQFLEIYRGDEKVRYIGPRLHFGNPDKDSYLAIDPGSAVSELVDLRTLWEFNSSGNHVANLRAQLHDVVHHPKRPPRKISKFRPVVLEDRSVSFYVAQDTFTKTIFLPSTGKPGHFLAAFQNCDDNQQKKINAAMQILLDELPDVQTTLYNADINSAYWASTSTDSCFACVPAFGPWGNTVAVGNTTIAIQDSVWGLWNTAWSMLSANCLPKLPLQMRKSVAPCLL